MLNTLSEEQVYKKASLMCAKQEKCISEIKEKLRLLNVPKENMQPIIERLIAENYINESRYAVFFTNDKIKMNKWGKMKIAQALRMKHISQETIDEAFENINDEEYSTMIAAELQKKKRTLGQASGFEMKQKLLRFAFSRGYEQEIVLELINNF